MRKMPDGEDTPYEVNISLFDAFKGTVAGGPDDLQAERFLCAHTILLALEGIPAIYVHSLLATENDHELVEETGRPRSINRHRWEIEDLYEVLGNPMKHNRRVFDELKRVIRIRREQDAFHPNATQYTLHFGDSIFGFWRESRKRDQNIFALHNISAEHQTLSLVELNLIGTESWRDLLTGTVFTDLEQVIDLAPYQCLWISNR